MHLRWTKVAREHPPQNHAGEAKIPWRAWRSDFSIRSGKTTFLLRWAIPRVYGVWGDGSCVFLLLATGSPRWMENAWENRRLKIRLFGCQVWLPGSTNNEESNHGRLEDFESGKNIFVYPFLQQWLFWDMASFLAEFDVIRFSLTLRMNQRFVVPRLSIIRIIN